MVGAGFNTHEAWEQLGVDPKDANAMLKVMLNLSERLHVLAKDLERVEAAFTNVAETQTEIDRRMLEVEHKVADAKVFVDGFVNGFLGTNGIAGKRVV